MTGALAADGEARPPETRAEARRRLALQRDLAVRLAEQRMHAEASAWVRAILSYRDLRNPSADPVELLRALDLTGHEAFHRHLVPALLDVMAAGMDAAVPGAGVLADLDRTSVVEYLSTVENRVVGSTLGGDPLARAAPIADEMVGAWRTVVTDAVQYGWGGELARAALAEQFEWSPTATSARKMRDRWDGYIDRRLPPGMTRNDYEAAVRRGALSPDPALDTAIARRDATARRLAEARGPGRARFLDPDGVIRNRRADNPKDGTLLVARPGTAWESRADRIARTETIGAYNFGTADAAKDAGVGFKEWLATPDPRTRDSHLAVSGECVPTDGTFSNGLRYPGDPDGPAREVVNCRCTLLVLDECGEDAEAQAVLDDAIEAEADRRGLDVDSDQPPPPERFDPVGEGRV